MGDAYKALRDATQAIRLTPDNAEAHQIRGMVYLGRGQFERAAADLQQALQRDATLSDRVRPRLAEAYAGWAEELEDAGDSVAAEERRALARDLDPQATATEVVAEATPVEQEVAKPVIDDADKKLSRGRELQAAKRYDEALIEFTEAVSLRPGFHEAYLRRGETLLAMGFPDTALEDLKRSVHRGGGSVEAFRLQATAHMALGNPHRAALSATDALHVEPRNGATYALRGEAYLELENWDRAEADLAEAGRRSPELAESLAPKLAAVRDGRAAARRAAAEAVADRADGEASLLRVRQRATTSPAANVQ